MGKKANPGNQVPAASLGRTARRASEGFRAFPESPASQGSRAETASREKKATLDPQALPELSLTTGCWARRENGVTPGLRGPEGIQAPEASQDSRGRQDLQATQSRVRSALPASLGREARKATRGPRAYPCQDQVDATGSRAHLVSQDPLGSQATQTELWSASLDRRATGDLPESQGSQG